VGASLSTAGVVFQALLRNPLAEPYILGVSGGAAVGAILSIILGLSVISLATPLLAISGAALTVFLVFAIGKSKGRTDSTTLLLAGVIVNAFFSAVIMFLLSLSKSSDLHSIAFWLMGDLGAANKMKIALISSFSFFGTGLVYTYARSLNLIVSGEETALQLGIDVERTKTILIIAASAITGFAVAFSGIIGFVGLIIPHVMRMLFGPDHRLLIPAAFFCGASFLVAADTVARTVLPSVELPVGVITALCGAPYFIFLLKRRSL
jgi:iron complex transport system permease protein